MSLEWMKKIDFLKSEAFRKVLRGAAVAAAGAVLTYFSQWLLSVDFGPWTAVAVAVSSVLVNIGKVLIVVK